MEVEKTKKIKKKAKKNKGVNEKKRRIKWCLFCYDNIEHFSIVSSHKFYTKVSY